MKKYLSLSVALVILLAALFVAVQPTQAVSYVDPELECEKYLGGKWDDSQNTCRIRTNGWWFEYWQGIYDMYGIDFSIVQLACGEVKNANTWDLKWDFFDFGWGTFYGWRGQGCSYSPLPTLQADVTAGTPLDMYYGNCGISIPNPPLNGSATLNKSRFADVGFVKAACTANYYDFNGTHLPGYGTTATVYINLNSQTYKQFMDGKLDIFTYNETDGWRACSATWYPLPDSDYGRLGCTTTDPTFGLGRIGAENLGDTPSQDQQSGVG